MTPSASPVVEMHAGKSRRRRFRFGLRSLFVLVAILAVLLSVWWYHVGAYRRQRLAINELFGMGAKYGELPWPDEKASPWVKWMVPEEDLIRVRCMTLGPEIGDAELPRAVAACNDLIGFEVLTVTSPRVTGDGLRYLAELHDVQMLKLYGTHAHGPELRRLSRMKNLRALDCCEDTKDEDLAFLTDVPQLEFLDLGGTQITDDSLQQLKQLPNLSGLYLQGTNVTDKGMVHVGELHKLEYLILMDTEVTDAGVECLTELKNLRHLDLTGTRITEASLLRLKPLFKDLRGVSYRRTLASKVDQDL